MTQDRNLATLIRENKTIFIIIGVALLLIELEIFAVAAMKSGRKSWLQVIDDAGNVIHETDGENLSEFNKYYFEKTFGPFEQYNVRLKTKDAPFPFRAWFVAAVGVPIGVILLFGFVVKAYLSLFYGDARKTGPPDPQKSEYETRLEKVIAGVSRFNIFTIGFLILIAVLSYWIVPNMIAYIGKAGMDALMRFKWFFLSFAIAVFGLFSWVIYLRYLLAKKTIDSQAEVERFRLQLAWDKNATEVKPANPELPAETHPMVSWEDPAGDGGEDAAPEDPIEVSDAGSSGDDAHAHHHHP